MELQQQDRQLERREHELERLQQEQEEREKQQRERPHQELEAQLQLQREELQERQEDESNRYYTHVDRIGPTKSKNNVIMWATTQRLLDTMVTRLGIHPRDIGVSLPYKAGILHANNKFSQSEHLSSLTAVTIESVQGADKKYVVICLVCNQGSGPGFVSNKRRLTVALSRKMQHIIVVGDQLTT